MRILLPVLTGTFTIAALSLMLGRDTGLMSCIALGIAIILITVKFEDKIRRKKRNFFTDKNEINFLQKSKSFLILFGGTIFAIPLIILTF